MIIFIASGAEKMFAGVTVIPEPAAEGFESTRRLESDDRTA